MPGIRAEHMADGFAFMAGSAKLTNGTVVITTGLDYVASCGATMDEAFGSGAEFCYLVADRNNAANGQITITCKMLKLTEAAPNTIGSDGDITGIDDEYVNWWAFGNKKRCG